MTATEPDAKVDAIVELGLLKQERLKLDEATTDLRKRTMDACRRAHEAGLTDRAIAEAVGRSFQLASNYRKGRTR